MNASNLRRSRWRRLSWPGDSPGRRRRSALRGTAFRRRVLSVRGDTPRLLSYAGTGGSLSDGVYSLTLTYADITSGASGSGISSDRTWSFHRLFGDLNGNGTVASTDPSDYTAFNAAFGSSNGSPLYDPAFDYNHDGIINSIDYSQFRNRYNANSGAGTTYSYSNSSPILAGASTTAPAGQTDISAWAAANTLDLYNDSAGRVVEERQAGSTGASKQFVWGLSYVNDLLEQDTATAVDAGGVLPNQHLLTYALDPSFNSTGTLVGPAGSYDGVAIQPADNKVVVAGVSGSNLLVTRYFANGAVDPSFGSSGTVTIAETSPTFCRLALDASGNIVVAVDSGGTGGPVQVSRLTPSGGLDNSSGSGGTATITFATGVVPQGIAIQADGKIDVVGDSTSGTGIYLARLTTGGTLDTAFGSSGEVNAPLGGAPSGLSIAVDASGDLLVGGSDGGDMSVVRFTTSGALDTTFNTTGEAKADFGATDTAYAVSPGPHGAVVAAGTSDSAGTYNHAIARWTSSGSLDTTFGGSGEVLGTGGTGVIRAMLVEPNGSILAGGDANGATAQKVWKFLANGTADSEFNTGGSITANSGATVYGWAITSGPTQRVVVAGSYNGNAALAAFAPASLRLYAQHDANFDTTALADANGVVQERFVYDPYGSVKVLSPQWQPASDTFGPEYLFQGMRYDPATGLYHTSNREYSATLGRWMQPDPAGYVDGSNLYQSFNSSPALSLDPLGLDPAEEDEVDPAKGLEGQVGGTPPPVPRTNGGTFNSATGMMTPSPPVEAPPAEAPPLTEPPTPAASSSAPEPAGEPASLTTPSGTLPEGHTSAPGNQSDPYSPQSVEGRQSDLRSRLGIKGEPGKPLSGAEIPDVKRNSLTGNLECDEYTPGHNVKGSHTAGEGAPHETGERNVNSNEEHSRVAKGTGGRGARRFAFPPFIPFIPLKPADPTPATTQAPATQPAAALPSGGVGGGGGRPALPMTVSAWAP